MIMKTQVTIALTTFAATLLSITLQTFGQATSAEAFHEPSGGRGSTRAHTLPVEVGADVEVRPPEFVHWPNALPNVEVQALHETSQPLGERASNLQPAHAAKPNPTPRGFTPNVGQLPNEAVKFALRDS